MINFIRGEGKAVGRWPPDLSSRDAFQSEHWLKPQLEDDALLYSLHDIIGEDLEDAMNGLTFGVGQVEVTQQPQRGYNLSSNPRPDNPVYRIAEMEQQVRNAQRDLERHRQLLASDLQLYGRLGNGLAREENTAEARNRPHEVHASETELRANDNTSTLNGDTDTSYFASYSGHGRCFFDLVRWSNANIDRHTRNDVERHNSNRCLQRFHIREQRSFQEQDRIRCWLRHRYIIHVLCKGWSKKSNRG